MKKTLLTIGALLFAGAVSQAALADSFYIVSSNGNSLGCSVSAPCAEVTITTSGDDATFTVTSLLSGYVIDTFGFNFTGAGSLTYVPSSATGEIDTSKNSFGLGNAGNEDGWGNFDYNFGTGKSGGSSGSDCTVTSGVASVGCTFTFTVTDSSTSSLTASEFESATAGSNTPSTTDFADHMAASGNSGFAGGTDPLPTPEPSSLLLLGTGILGAGLLVRRRMQSMQN